MENNRLAWDLNSACWFHFLCCCMLYYPLIYDTHQKIDKGLIKIPYFCHALFVYNHWKGITLVVCKNTLLLYWVCIVLFCWVILSERRQSVLLDYCLFDIGKQRFLHEFHISFILSLWNVKLLIQVENHLRHKSYLLHRKKRNNTDS